MYAGAQLAISVPRDDASGYVNNKRDAYNFRFQHIFPPDCECARHVPALVASHATIEHTFTHARARALTLVDLRLQVYLCISLHSQYPLSTPFG